MLEGKLLKTLTPDTGFSVVSREARMDSIFEEDTSEVGGEIEAYCPSPRCKADTTHTIIYMYEDEVRRVQCVVCGEVHAYRKPRGDGVEEAGEGATKKSSQRRMTWDDAMVR